MRDADRHGWGGGGSGEEEIPNGKLHFLCIIHRF